MTRALANYRQTVLSAFQEVEDNLAANTLLAEEAALQNEAVVAARQSTTSTLNQYKAGTVSYLDVVTIQFAQPSMWNARPSNYPRPSAQRCSVVFFKAAARGGNWDATQQQPRRANPYGSETRKAPGAFGGYARAR